MDGFIDILAGFSGVWAYLIIFLWLLVCGLGVPLPEDISLFAAGLLCFYGAAQVHLMVAVSFFGVLLGDGVIFLIGRKYGRLLLDSATFKKIMKPSSLEKANELFQKRGNTIVFFARFAPGLRAPIFFSAGMLGIPYRVFLFFDGLAALISVPLIVYVSFYFGSDIHQVISAIRKTNAGIFALFMVAAIVFFLRRYLAKRRMAKQQDDTLTLK